MLAVALSAGISFGQHHWQVDDGAGHYSLLVGANPGGTYTLPPNGGMIITTTPGSPSAGWLTAGNTTGSIRLLGSLDAFDVSLIANSSEKLRLVNGGGVTVTGGLTLNGMATGIVHSNGSGVLSSSTIATADIGNSQVTYGKIQNVAANRLLGNPTGGSAAPTEIGLTAPVTFSGGNLQVNTMGASGGSHATGLVPDPGAVAGTTKFLREDGTWQVPAAGGNTMVLKHKNANTSRNNTTTLTDDPDIQGVAIGAGEVWEFEGIIRATSSSSNPDIQFRLHTTTNATIVSSYIGRTTPGDNGNGADVLDVSGGTNTNTSNVAISGGDVITFIVHGTVVGGASGSNLSFQWSQDNNSAFNTTVQAGSYLKFTKF